jgi:hypothetical protein
MRLPGKVLETQRPASFDVGRYLVKGLPVWIFCSPFVDDFGCKVERLRSRERAVGLENCGSHGCTRFAGAVVYNAHGHDFFDLPDR